MKSDKTSSKRWQAVVAALCGSIHPEDGQDPRLRARTDSRKKTTRNAYQVCKQAHRTLSLVFTGDLDDPRLATIRVRSVDPIPDSPNLLVILDVVMPGDAEEAPNLVAAQEALAAVQGRLRTAVAQALHRKRVPMLTFRLVPAGEDAS